MSKIVEIKRGEETEKIFSIKEDCEFLRIKSKKLLDDHEFELKKLMLQARLMKMELWREINEFLGDQENKKWNDFDDQFNSDTMEIEYIDKEKEAAEIQSENSQSKGIFGGLRDLIS